MMKKHIFRVVVLIGILSLFSSMLSGCFAQKYQVDYCGSKYFYEGAKDSYPAGAQVEFYCTLIPSDTDISFYLNDAYLDAEFDNEKGYIIRFTMPKENVRLELRTRESMTYVEAVEPGVLLVEYYRKETGESDAYYELVLTTTTDPSQYQLDEYQKENGGEEIRTSYQIPFDIWSDCLGIIETYAMRDWESTNNPVALDGTLIVCKFRDGEETIRVSSEQMPQNGEQGLEKIREALADCLRKDFLIENP